MAYRRIQRVHCLNHGPDTLNDTDLDYIAKLGELVVGRSLLSELSHVDLIVDGRYLQSHVGALGNCFQHAYLWMTKSSESIEDADITYADLITVLNKIVVSDYFIAILGTPLDVDVAATAATGTGNYVQVLDPSDNDSEFPIWPETTDVGEDDVFPGRKMSREAAICIKGSLRHPSLPDLAVLLSLLWIFISLLYQISFLYSWKLTSICSISV